MNQTERLYRIDQLLRDRGPISFESMKGELEVSRATLRRDLTAMRDRYNAPIEYDRDAGGYQYGKPIGGPKFQLPGLWFSADEALALLTMHELLSSLDAGGLLGTRLRPLVDRLLGLLNAEDMTSKELLRRVKIVPSQQRRVDAKWFCMIGRALVSRKRLWLRYWSRQRDEQTEREVSPQRLVHYRNAWYLDAWCHLNEEMRTFSLDAVEEAQMLDAAAKNASFDQFDRENGAGYGIFRGSQVRHAVVRFSEEAARWVRSEVWHPDQRGRLLQDGRYELRIPFADSVELIMDLLRHADQVEVVEPASLRRRFAEKLESAVSNRAGKSPSSKPEPPVVLLKNLS